LLVEQGTGGRYRLHLERSPDTANLPAGLNMLAREGDWWRLQLQPGTPKAPSAFWGELILRGWRILEIRSEASGLEELYLNITDQTEPSFQEQPI
jgi:ABC-2 type transport system ATP-binding protein